MQILTFDIEDWFHLLNNPHTKSVDNWKEFESRIDLNMDKIFKLLDETNTKATFLVLGWIAEKYPHIVKKINSLGYEIGSHTHTHQLVFEQTPTEFENDVKKSINTLEDITGRKVKIFRAPSFSITNNNLWALESLVKLGIEIDCSIFPGKRNNGGLEGYQINNPFIITYNGLKIKEFPVNYQKCSDLKLIYIGGGYFRLFPKFIIKYLIKNNDYNMAYFHPRDFDYLQPKIRGLSILNTFKSYVGLKNSLSKLKDILNSSNFKDISYYDNSIDWNNCKTLNL